MSSTKTLSSSYATACVFEVARQKHPSRKKFSEKSIRRMELEIFFRKNRKKLWKTLTFVVFSRGVVSGENYSNLNFPAKIEFCIMRRDDDETTSTMSWISDTSTNSRRRLVCFVSKSSLKEEWASAAITAANFFEGYGWNKFTAAIAAVTDRHGNMLSPWYMLVSPPRWVCYHDD